MTTITLTINVDGSEDDYEISVRPRRKPKVITASDLIPTDTWDVQSSLEYFAKLQPHVLVMFAALIHGDRTTTYLKDVVGFESESQVAGALAWPGRFASEMGKKLPWSYDNVTVKMLSEVKPVFAQAFQNAADEIRSNPSVQRFLGK